MKKRIIFGIFIGMILVMGFSGYSIGSAEELSGDAAMLVKGNNAFAFDLYAALAGEQGNLFFSPYSVSSALAMTYAGARGETAQQMEKTLHFDLAGENLHTGFAGLTKQFNASGKPYQLSVANALWGQRGTAFEPEFLENAKTLYDAGFKEVDYAGDTEGARRIINDWVETKTNRKIKELIKPRILNELTRLVLTNAVYFKGQWKSQFKPEDTQEAPFYASPEKSLNVRLMTQTGRFRYGETDQYQMVELPYSGDEIAMEIVLPKPESDLSKLEANLRSADFEFATMSLRKVEVFLPRFTLTKSLSLNESLQRLGMKDAFSEKDADFSGISTKTYLYITHVVHKAFVDVNEEGTEAAASTGVVVGTKSAARTITFRADRPFFFVIRDLRSGSILFMGRLVNPES